MSDITERHRSVPAVSDLRALRETIWFNDQVTTAERGLLHTGLTREEAEDAEARLRRFAPLIAAAFPETAESGGIIESDMVPLPAMQARLAQLKEGDLVDFTITQAVAAAIHK